MFPTRKEKPSSDYTKIDPETGEILHDAAGREIPDPTPMQPPVGYNPQPSLASIVRQQIMSHKLAQEAAAMGAETFEEADDFEVGDDWEAEKHSPYEANFDPMTPEEKAALTTQGRDTEKILTQEEKDLLTPKPKKEKSRAATSSTPVSEAPSAEDLSDEGA